RPPEVRCWLPIAARRSVTTSARACSMATSSRWGMRRFPGRTGCAGCNTPAAACAAPFPRAGIGRHIVYRGTTDMSELNDIQSLLNIMARLRDPQHGCPWDLQQDFSSIAPYTLEEAYEV